MGDTADDGYLRPDGGIDIPNPASPDSVPADALTPEALARSAPRLETIVELFNHPALARVYVYICYWGPVSPPAVMDTLDLSKSTAYDYVDRLVDLGLVERDDSTRPQQLTADAIALLDRHAPVVVTPTVLHAFALQEIDEDVEYFLDRHGVGKLVAALRGAGLHYAGETTQRMVASDIDVRDSEAMLVVNALAPVLAVGRDRDPYFETLFPDVRDAMDLPDLDAVETAPPLPDSG